MRKTNSIYLSSVSDLTFLSKDNVSDLSKHLNG